MVHAKLHSTGDGPACAGSVAMFRKILIGMALVAIGCAVAGAGYKTGQYLAEKERAAQKQAA